MDITIDFITVIIIHRWSAEVCRGWATTSACCLQVSLYCAITCQIGNNKLRPDCDKQKPLDFEGMTCQGFLPCMHLGSSAGKRNCQQSLFDTFINPLYLSHLMFRHIQMRIHSDSDSHRNAVATSEWEM